MNKNDQVMVSGKIKAAFSYDHEENGKAISKTELDIIRKNHKYPHTVTIMIPAEMIKDSENYTDQIVIVTGGLRSFDTDRGEAHDRGIYILAETINTSQEKYVNEVCLKGVLCQRPLTKILPHDNLMAIFLLSVDYQGQTEYIPCSVGDMMAMDVATMDIGTVIEISGRIHSRGSKVSVWVYQDTTCLRRI